MSADEISKFYDLKEKGAITEDEYNKAKERILLSENIALDKDQIKTIAVEDNHLVKPPVLPPPLTSIATNREQVPKPPIIPTNQIDLSSFDKYYQEEFRKIFESNEKYVGKWNWYSFLFSSLWCFYKGCWVFGFIITVSMILTYGTRFYFILIIGWGFLMGMRGTWLLYNVKIKHKQSPKSWHWFNSRF